MKNIRNFILGICLVLFSIGILEAQEKNASVTQLAPEVIEFAEKLTQKMVYELALSSEEKLKIHAANLVYAQNVIMAKSQNEEESDELNNALNLLKEERMNALKEVLSAEKMQEWNEFLADIYARPESRAGREFSEY